MFNSVKYPGIVDRKRRHPTSLLFCWWFSKPHRQLLLKWTNLFSDGRLIDGLAVELPFVTQPRIGGFESGAVQSEITLQQHRSRLGSDDKVWKTAAKCSTKKSSFSCSSKCLPRFLCWRIDRRYWCGDTHRFPELLIGQRSPRTKAELSGKAVATWFFIVPTANAQPLLVLSHCRVVSCFLVAFSRHFWKYRNVNDGRLQLSWHVHIITTFATPGSQAADKSHLGKQENLSAVRHARLKAQVNSRKVWQHYYW